MRLPTVRAAVMFPPLLATLATMGGSAGEVQGWTETRSHAATGAAAPARGDCMDYYGTNLNEFLSIQEQIIGPPGCREVLAGEKWVLSLPGWRTAADGIKAVYPDGYRPPFSRGVPPMLDFQAKFRGARVILDNGTKRKTFTFGREILQGISRTDELENTAFASRPLAPLPAGKYKIIAFLRMSHEHYDGVGRALQTNRVPSGELRFPDFPFEVIPRQDHFRA